MIIESKVVIPGIDNILERLLHSLTVNVDYHLIMNRQIEIDSKIDMIRITDVDPGKCRIYDEIVAKQRFILNENIKKVSVRMQPGIKIPMNDAEDILDNMIAWTIGIYPKLNFLDIEDQDYSDRDIKVLFCSALGTTVNTQLKLLFVNDVLIITDEIKKEEITPPLYHDVTFTSDYLNTFVNLGRDRNYICLHALSSKDKVRKWFLNLTNGIINYYSHIKKDFMRLNFSNGKYGVDFPDDMLPYRYSPPELCPKDYGCTRKEKNRDREEQQGRRRKEKAARIKTAIQRMGGEKKGRLVMKKPQII